jgi:hypothetical protein
MPTVRVIKHFILQHDDGRKVEYIPGRYEVDEETAAHWYFQAHLEGYEEPPPPDGTQQYAQKMLNVEQAVRMGEPVADQGQKPAPTPPGTQRAEPDTHYFAGEKITHPEGPSWLPGKAL